MEKSKRGRKPKVKEEAVKVESNVITPVEKVEEQKLPETPKSIPVIEEKSSIEETGKEIGNKIQDVNFLELLWNSFMNLFKNK